MNNQGLKRMALVLIALTIAFVLFSGKLAVPMNIRFFAGSFGIGAGIVLIICANIIGLHRD